MKYSVHCILVLLCFFLLSGFSSPTQKQGVGGPSAIAERLMGTWNETCDGWRGTVSYFSDHRIVMEYKGKKTEGVWIVEKNTIKVQYKGDKVNTWLITSMGQNRFELQCGQTTCMANRVR